MLHRISVKIYYEDTDAAGLVYYGNFLRYLERARTEFLQEYGINIAELHYRGIFFPVVHVDIAYKRPARLGDVIDITTEVHEMKKASAVLKSSIFKNETVLAEAKVTFACINMEGKATRFPEEFRKLGGF